MVKAQVNVVKSRNKSTMEVRKKRLKFYPADENVYESVRLKKNQIKSLDNILRFESIH